MVFVVNATFSELQNYLGTCSVCMLLPVAVASVSVVVVVVVAAAAAQVKEENLN